MKQRAVILPAGLILLSLACNLPSAARETAVAASLTAFAAAPPTSGAPTAAPTSTASASPAPQPTPTETQPHIVEQTLFEGEKAYTCDEGGCWRDDGILVGPPENFYPDIHEDNRDIRALLASIGLPAEEAPDNAERWRRIRGLWQWMTSHTIIINEPGYEEPWNYLHELASTPTHHWPSIGELAKVFARFGVLPLGACNSKSFTMATLLYRVGVLPDWITVVHSQAHDGTQHIYLGIHLDGRWRYLDPTCIRSHTALAPQPETVGCIGADYRHPYEVIPLPGSQLIKPMLLE
ncbi:MAG: hypothetical protein JW929_12390 [Anaerolineales bacterium]|nr:hypothetical protein [Anaerolineales bacterium]